MTSPDIVYVTYIATTPEKAWEALIRAEFIRQYFFGIVVDSDWRVGSEVEYRLPDGTPHIRGQVLACDPPRQLSMTWTVVSHEDFRKLPPATITFTIEPLGDVVRLTVVESNPELLDDRILEGGRQGWPVILCSLKTLLETGSPLPAFEMPDQAQVMAEMEKAAREYGQDPKGLNNG